MSTRVLEREIGEATLKGACRAGVSKKLTKRRVFSQFRRRAISPSRRRDNGRRHIIKTRSSSFVRALKIDSAQNGTATGHPCRFFLSHPVLGSDSRPLGNRSSGASTCLHAGENQVFFEDDSAIDTSRFSRSARHFFRIQPLSCDNI